MENEYETIKDYIDSEKKNILSIGGGLGGLEIILNKQINVEEFTIFDYDKDELPNKTFDLIISLFSLDYHYNFDIYSDYLKKNSHKDTKIIFDTIRADYFKEIFEEVHMINDRTNTLHKSKRIVCRNFLSK